MACGDVLAFVDADSRIHPQTFNAVERAIADPRTAAGATGVQRDRMSLGIAVTYAVVTLAYSLALLALAANLDCRSDKPRSPMDSEARDAGDPYGCRRDEDCVLTCAIFIFRQIVFPPFVERENGGFSSGGY